MSVDSLDFKIRKGLPFREVLRWESKKTVFIPIAEVLNEAPMKVVLAENVGLPVNWRFQISGVEGSREVNTGAHRWYFNSADSDSGNLIVDYVDATKFQPSEPLTGNVNFFAPVSLRGLSARVVVRQSVTSDEVLLEMTTEDGSIVLDDSRKTITLNLPAAVTENLCFYGAVYQMDIKEIATGFERPFISGSISVIKGAS